MVKRQFSCSVAWAFLLTLTVSCNDKLAVTGGAAMEWAPRALTFPNTMVGSFAEDQLVLKNVGDRAVRVDSIALVAGGSAAFTLTDGAFSAPRTINPRGIWTVKVKYAPLASGDARATLRAKTESGNLDAVVTNLRPSPRVELDPRSLDFGIVAQGQSRERELRIRNTGTASLRVARIALSSATSREFSVDLNGNTLPFDLDILQVRVIKVRFAPSAPGSRTGSLDVTTDDPTTPLARAPLSSGESVAGISVDPLSIAFGDVEQDETETREVRITNTGTAELRVTPSITGASDFHVDATPLVIAPNDTATLDVEYTPTDPGLDQGNLVLTHNAPDSPTQVALTGGAEPTIALSPGAVQFSNVAQFQMADIEVVLSNTGFGELVLGTVAFGTGANESSPELTLRDVPAVGTRLRRGQSARFTVRYNKQTLSNPTGVIYVRSNDPDSSQNPFVLYVLARDGIGDPPPTAVIACTNCNGTTLQGTLPVTVQLDGTMSSDPQGQALIHSWALTSSPAQSQAVITSTAAPRTTFVADVAGTYRVSLVVTDASGQLSPRVTRDLTLLP